MDEPIENLYFNWLYTKVVSIEGVSTPSLSYVKLIKALHNIEFVWLVSGDDNRAEDGVALRKEFLQEAFMKSDPSWMGLPCSVLEMLIAFSRVASFETGSSSREWFWRFLQNLGLSELNDASRSITSKVSNAIDILIWRTYDPNGHGGLFPLDHPEENQKETEIWYQFCAYLFEYDLL